MGWNTQLPYPPDSDTVYVMETNESTLTDEIDAAMRGEITDIDLFIGRLAASPLSGPAVDAIANIAISGGIDAKSPNCRDFAHGYRSVSADGRQSPAMVKRGADFATEIAEVLAR